MTKSAFPQKNDWVKLSELLPTLKKSESPTFQALSYIKNDKVLFSKFILTIKYCKDYFPNFSAIKNDKVQLSELFPPIKIKKFRTISDIKNYKVQISALFPT